MKRSYLLGAVLVLTSLTLMSCAKSQQKSEQTSSSTSSSVQVKKDSSDSSSKESKSKDYQERKRIGSPEFGYIDIPSKWVKFIDAEVDGLIQYTDGSAYNIVTMNAISKEEADWLKKEEHIDAMRPNVVHAIMNAYNIMCFIVVDEPLEKVHFLYDDGTTAYETISFSHLEREANDGQYKKIINLLSKSR